MRAPTPVGSSLAGLLTAAALALTAPVLFTGSAAAQTCSGFPWTVTASSVGGTVVAHVCGTTTGCLPHAPASNIVGSTIVLTVTQAEPPSCQCVQPVFDFAQDFVVPNVPPGSYDVVAHTLNCQNSTETGRTTVQVGEAATVPTLDAIGLAALVIAIGAAGIWRLPN